jgi:hypothetical protein
MTVDDHDLTGVLGACDALRRWKAGTPINTLAKSVSPETRAFLGWNEPAPIAKAAPTFTDTNTLHGLADIERRRNARKVARPRVRIMAKARPPKPTRAQLHRAAQAQARADYGRARRAVNSLIGTVPAHQVAEAEARLCIAADNARKARLL